jgi:hypothetical protein
MGIYKSGANMLTDNSAPFDPQMGTYQLRALLCRVRKAESSPLEDGAAAEGKIGDA